MDGVTGPICPPDHVWEGVQPGVIQDEATVEGTDQAGLLVGRREAVGGVGAGGQELQLQLGGGGSGRLARGCWAYLWVWRWDCIRAFWANLCTELECC